MTALLALGVTVTEPDPLLDLILQQVSYRVLNETNTILPMAEGLESIAVDITAGEYLKFKKGTGGLSGFELEAVVKQVQEGDTNIQYAIGEGCTTPEQRLDAIILGLTGRERELSRFRRIAWD